MKKFLTLSILSAACLAFTAGSVLANYGDDNSLNGYVKVEKSLVPIKGAKVGIYSTSGKKKDSTKTDKKGKYYFGDLQEKKYKIKVSATGFHSPKDVKKNTVSYTVKVDGGTRKNVFLAK